MNDRDEQRDFVIHPETRIGYVSLNVSDLDRSLDFYKSVLGFRQVGNASDRAMLSVEGNTLHLIELKQSEKAAVQKRAGLYHFAILLPERKYLADMLQNLREKQSSMHFDGLSNHLVSESIYIRDLDFNGIEIYRDRPHSEWVWDGNRVRMATTRLDTEDLLQQSTAAGWSEMPAKTVIGHIHLHVSSLEEAMKFYSATLGLHFTASYPGAHFFAAGMYHHHVATNTWLGDEILPAAPDRVGLNHFGIELADSDALARTVANVVGQGVKNQSEPKFVQDADGIRMRLYSK